LLTSQKPGQDSGEGVKTTMWFWSIKKHRYSASCPGYLLVVT
jgi:hypothetical protein